MKIFGAKFNENNSFNIGTGQSHSDVEIFNGYSKETHSNEILIMPDISDSDIKRQKYIQTTKSRTYKVVSGDNISKIAEKFGVETNYLLSANNLNEKTGANLKLGQIIKIPETRKVKNVKNLKDVSLALGVSENFIKNLKKIEDNAQLGPNEFHNTPYKDKAGVETIGIGHALRKGESRYLSDEEVCSLLAKDLLKAEENLYALIGDKQKYNKLPKELKEALLDMVFNKGTSIIEDTSGLLWCLKNGKYEAAINKFTHNKSAKTGKAMSGLNKRRLFEISLACKMYNGNIPQSNMNTIQQLYKQGTELLRNECRAQNLKFENILVDYQKEVSRYFDNKIKF